MKKEAVTIQENRKDLLRENARLRGDLLSVARRISHDLRTPLGGILSLGELLKEMLKDSDPKLAQLATGVLSWTEEMLQIIKRTALLLTASSSPCHLDPVSMGDAVSDALLRLGSEIRKRGATISQCETWPEVKGRSEWLGEIWWNFLDNALRHSGQKPRIELGWREIDGKFQFWISDGGPGVPSDRLKQLFQPFHQLHEFNASRGLGLSSVQRFVELQGGECFYKPNKQGGAGFFFTLPRLKGT